MNGIFITYRQEDAKPWALWLRKELGEVFGDESVFLVKDTLQAGNWRAQIHAALNQSRVVLVVIGRHWLTIADETGLPRLNLSDDLHRQEIALALSRKEVTVIPVRVDGVAMPRADDLPTDIRSLSDQLSRELSGTAARRKSDMQLLIEDIRRITGQQPAKPQSSPRPSFPRLRIPRRGSRHNAPEPALEPEEVHLGAAAPRAVCPGEEFVARIAAYTEAHRSEVVRVITQEAPSAQPRLDLETCRWHPGTKVTVRLDAHYVEVSNPIQTFKWNGARCVLRFDAKVPIDIEVNTIVLKFDIAVEGLPIMAIRPEIAVSRKEKEKAAARSVPLLEQSAPRSAFASYAKKDRRDVLGRVRSLQIFTGIDVFLDCLSIRPGEEWKAKLKKEIHDRDVFWLFWSRSAIASEWVEWEWRTALAEKSVAAIQPHPLEPSELAPPPKELSSLQFGAIYEWYVSELRESPIARLFRPLLHKAASFYEAYRWCFAVAVAIIIGAFAWYM